MFDQVDTAVAQSTELPVAPAPNHHRYARGVDTATLARLRNLSRTSDVNSLLVETRTRASTASGRWNVIVWTAPQTWDWAHSLNARKALAATALMLLSIAALTTQAYNPFIYFIF